MADIRVFLIKLACYTVLCADTAREFPDPGLEAVTGGTPDGMTNQTCIRGSSSDRLLRMYFTDLDSPVNTQQRNQLHGSTVSLLNLRGW